MTFTKLQTMPGVGPITALAVETFAPPMEQLCCDRDVLTLVWTGAAAALVWRETEAGENVEEGAARYPAVAGHRGDGCDPPGLTPGCIAGSWLARMLEQKPLPVVAVALANKMARGIWAMLTHGEKLSRPGADRRPIRRQKGSRTTEL